MANHDISRRRAGHIMLAAAATACLAPGALGAQPYGKKKDKDKNKKPNGQQPATSGPVHIDATKILVPDKRRDWTLHGEVNVDAFVQRAARPKEQLPEIHEFDFTSAAIIFPLLRGSSSHRMYDNELKSKVSWDGAVLLESVSDMRDGYASGARLGRWDLRPPQGKRLHGREMKLEVDISMTSWRTRFDEELAKQVPWPKGPWGPIAASTFTDLQRLGELSLVNHAGEVVQSLVREWCNSKDPKTVLPVELAKFLAGNVMEYIQPSGNGLNFADNGMLEGVQLIGSEEVLRTRRGSEQDVTCALAAVYRAAGLPARTVIGFDVQDDKGGKDTFLKRQRDVPNFRSWVEFCLYDEPSRREVWVPVDVNRQRSKSNRILNNPRAWRYFGENDELDLVCPFAFQYHPPTTVLAHGSPCFWGWMTFPEAPLATQFLRFSAMTTAKTKDTEKLRQQDPNAGNR